EAVLGVQEDVRARPEKRGDQVRDPDAEVDHLSGSELCRRTGGNHHLGVIGHGAPLTRWSTYRCGVTIDSGSRPPAATISPASAIVSVAAVAISGLKLRAVLRYQRFPSSSAFAAYTRATSARIGSSRTCSTPPSTRTSLPSASGVPTPTGV